MLGFAAFGLVLAALGVYGVMAFSVAQRTAEIGIRMALGGRPRDILPLILRRGLTLIAGGVGIGIVAAIVLNRALTGLLTQVGPLDRVVLGGASTVILLAAVLACIVPAVKAAHLDPLVALKSD
jgi:ABC-type antimicrobial peptide transport system permease subunit